MAPAPSDPPPRVTLVIGPEELLVERAVADVVAAARLQEPDLERRLVDAAADGAAAALAEALSPTLFGDSAVIVVSALDRAEDDLAATLVAAMADPPEHVWIVLVHPGGVKGKALLTAVRGAGAAEVPCPELKKGRPTVEFLTRELARHRRTATREAVGALYDAVGHDPRMLASAVAQLAVDVETDPIDVDDVSRYFGGMAEVTGFQISDAVWERRPTDALRNLRWTAEAGDRGRIGPATVGAVASGLRGLVRYAGASRGAPDAQLAREVGVPPWKLRVLRQQLGRWRPDQLAAAVLLLAATDAAVKGGLREGENLDAAQKMLALERLVVDTASSADPHPHDPA
jgi:DNA polymerase III subunit delta